MIMSRVHPSLRKLNDDDDEEGPAATMRLSPSAWTVWKKSSMAFQGTDGFSIYDSEGRLAFRVDNYSRKHKCFAGALLLMDGEGKALMALKPQQILSVRDKWSGFKCGDGLEMSHRTHAFSMRRRSILNGCEQAEVFMDSSSSTASFRTEGCFRRRNCEIKDGKGEEVVARISRKKVKNNSVTLGDDVFSLVIQPGVDAELVMAFLVVMDRIF
ncbi:protein LURP-one-related 5-like isoform X1 [Zingiber officinale]|uniref:protein LURP-one-related 5-like isoform X1 n=1 Tax=Zingiber officinale TaxID=94328 RepID=UPI001C4BFAEB|nr:protein LURP-one-related 5-like isoform X1 [Zingiber officinale]